MTHSLKILIYMSGEAHWLKPPTLARHHSNFAWVVLWQEVLVWNTELTSLHQLEEFGKGQKETPHVRPPLRILLCGIHLGWTRCASPGRTLSQNDWLKTTRKVIPSANYVTEQCYGFPSPPALHAGAFPVKSLALSAHVSPQTVHFQGLDKSPVLGPQRGPPSCNTMTATSW